jgi:hypothetical protein
MGYSTTSKKKSKKKDRDSYYYYFEKDACMRCPRSHECLYKGKKRKILQITLNTIALY